MCAAAATHADDTTGVMVPSPSVSNHAENVASNPCLAMEADQTAAGAAAAENSVLSASVDPPAAPSAAEEMHCAPSLVPGEAPHLLAAMAEATSSDKASSDMPGVHPGVAEGANPCGPAGATAGTSAAATHDGALNPTSALLSISSAFLGGTSAAGASVKEVADLGELSGGLTKQEAAAAVAAMATAAGDCSEGVLARLAAVLPLSSGACRAPPAKGAAQGGEPATADGNNAPLSDLLGICGGEAASQGGAALQETASGVDAGQPTVPAEPATSGGTEQATGAVPSVSELLLEGLVKAEQQDGGAAAAALGAALKPGLVPSALTYSAKKVAEVAKGRLLAGSAGALDGAGAGPGALSTAQAASSSLDVFQQCAPGSGGMMVRLDGTTTPATSPFLSSLSSLDSFKRLCYGASSPSLFETLSAGNSIDQLSSLSSFSLQALSAAASVDEAAAAQAAAASQNQTPETTVAALAGTQLQGASPQTVAALSSTALNAAAAGLAPNAPGGASAGATGSDARGTEASSTSAVSSDAVNAEAASSGDASSSLGLASPSVSCPQGPLSVLSGLMAAPGAAGVPQGDGTEDTTSAGGATSSEPASGANLAGVPEGEETGVSGGAAAASLSAGVLGAAGADGLVATSPTSAAAAAATAAGMGFAMDNVTAALQAEQMQRLLAEFASSSDPYTAAMAMGGLGCPGLGAAMAGTAGAGSSGVAGAGAGVAGDVVLDERQRQQLLIPHEHQLAALTYLQSMEGMTDAVNGSLWMPGILGSRLGATGFFHSLYDFANTALAAAVAGPAATTARTCAGTPPEASGAEVPVAGTDAAGAVGAASTGRSHRRGTQGAGRGRGAAVSPVSDALCVPGAVLGATEAFAQGAADPTGAGADAAAAAAAAAAAWGVYGGIPTTAGVGDATLGAEAVGDVGAAAQPVKRTRGRPRKRPAESPAVSATGAMAVKQDPGQVGGSASPAAPSGLAVGDDQKTGVVPGAEGTAGAAGGPGAAAALHRRQPLATASAPKRYRRGTNNPDSGFPGVSWNSRMQAWLAFYVDKEGTRRSHTFKCNKFGGIETARVEAIDWLIRKRGELQAESEQQRQQVQQQVQLQAQQLQSAQAPSTQQLQAQLQQRTQQQLQLQQLPFTHTTPDGRLVGLGVGPDQQSDLQLHQLLQEELLLQQQQQLLLQQHAEQHLQHPGGATTLSALEALQPTADALVCAIGGLEKAAEESLISQHAQAAAVGGSSDDADKSGVAAGVEPQPVEGADPLQAAQPDLTPDVHSIIQAAGGEAALEPWAPAAVGAAGADLASGEGGDGGAGLGLDIGAGQDGAALVAQMSTPEDFLQNAELGGAVGEILGSLQESAAADHPGVALGAAAEDVPPLGGDGGETRGLEVTMASDVAAAGTGEKAEVELGTTAVEGALCQ
ncbi:unnamed protein product [Neospora caninum Liverpool]|uniref:AP2 domain transcription factor AP2XI-3 n=1 Tax=Neospora caninum (strain Liverpool) TaxID=572307 RepID=F0VMX4_NEOCL|nr:uncharacterized protein NCLIV_054950 [Neospora caninum Liverpool]CBZ55070.1 unnamed protein product [Neospora caninum Liverpool]CEL69794.1 TPA: AP2 domain transcription factor AP2XI-3 [Neospora caninum Liverpool]|eukprot:XP_003885098.1 uncharacterized protein NCLIV_054950 [Neospora caninum Liverpool]